ncbi:uncharacterized protein LOC134818588 [Bolinopsis microptera]|uniref:uncharacterized protein LOC134818588 n=1 Tax=Bolinopsis microptera TaxID=2820187 RepID=UPI003078F886
MTLFFSLTLLVLISASATWSSKNDGKYLDSYSAGTAKYDSLLKAQSECPKRSDCGGITYEPSSKKFTLRRGVVLKDSTRSEISWVEVTWSSKNTGKYLDSYSAGTAKYDSLLKAQSECPKRSDCGGITYEPSSKKFTLRRGVVLKDSTRSEISWVEEIECPATHPNVYYNGEYCCKSNKEKVNTPQGTKCDGSVIQRDSLCCAGNQHTRCPSGSCRSLCDCNNINGDDFEATDIKYDMDKKIVSALRPDLVVNKVLNNRGSRDLVVPLSQTVEVENTMEFSHTAGASVTAGTSFEVGVPGLGAAGVSFEISASYEFSSGESKTSRKSISVEFSCTAPPKKRVVCNALKRKDKVSIPYVMTWTHKRSKECSCKEEGVFKELVSQNIEMEVNEFDLNSKKIIRTKREEIFDLRTSE